MSNNHKLDPRLNGVLELIQAEQHADIGSDHARLPVALVQSGRCKQVIVVELNPGPLAVAQQAVRQAQLSHNITVRQGNGLEPLLAHEVQSVSLTGMGARTILGILERATWQPPTLILQPNAEAGLLRQWAYTQGYWLSHESLLPGFWNYTVLRLDLPQPTTTPSSDPSYQGLPPNAAFHFGPHLLRARHPLLLEELEHQRQRLEPLLPHARPGIVQEWQRLQAALLYINNVSLD